MHFYFYFVFSPIENNVYGLPLKHYLAEQDILILTSWVLLMYGHVSSGAEITLSIGHSGIRGQQLFIAD